MVFTDCGLLYVCDFAKGCALSTFMGISRCCEVPFALPAPKSTVNSPMARRRVAGSASQIRHDLNHGEMGINGLVGSRRLCGAVPFEERVQSALA